MSFASWFQDEKCWYTHQVISSGNLQAAGHRPGGGVLGMGKVLVLKRLMAIPAAT
jgi:hypothetical protein